MQQGLTDLMNTAQNAQSSAASAAPVHGTHLFGITLIGATADNLHKLLLTIGFVLVAWLTARILRAILKLFIGSRSGTRFQFWAKQGVSLVIGAIVILGTMSIWFDNPARLAAALGLIGAGIAFALQRVITAVAGYFVILRGKTFNVGDRIMMGGVRGDVIDLSFMQTQIMEMGQSPKEQGDAPSMWVRSRQFTGRIVTVTNDKVFDEPVYNYSHDFPYIWDEINLPVRYEDDRAKAEQSCSKLHVGTPLRATRSAMTRSSGSRAISGSRSAISIRRHSGASPTTGWRSPCASSPRITEFDASRMK